MNEAQEKPGFYDDYPRMWAKREGAAEILQEEYMRAGGVHADSIILLHASFYMLPKHMASLLQMSTKLLIWNSFP